MPKSGEKKLLEFYIVRVIHLRDLDKSDLFRWEPLLDKSVYHLDKSDLFNGNISFYSPL